MDWWILRTIIARKLDNPKFVRQFVWCHSGFIVTRLYVVDGLKTEKNGLYGQRDEISLKKAVYAVLVDGLSEKKASKTFFIPRSTSIPHVELAKQGEGVKKFEIKPVLTDEQEVNLVSCINEMES